jgi:hypothetical protein
MTGENNPNNNPNTGPSQEQRVQSVESLPAAQTKPATEADLAKVEKQMSGFERATLRWARASFFIVFATAVFIGLQWREMYIGGQDTHNLAVAAANQASWTQRLAGNAQTQADRIKDLADRMKDQADRTKELAEQATIQAKAAQSAARAAKSSADTAIASLRPWIKITDVQTRGEGPEIPALSFQRGPTWPIGEYQATLQLKISVKNIGHSPARLTVDFKLFFPLWENGYSDVIYREKKGFCGEVAKKELKVDPTLQIILFPEETHDWYGGGAALVDSKVVNHFSDRGMVPYILPVVAVCTNYQFGDSPAIYQTSALYEIFRKDDRTRFFEVSKEVPGSQIFLIRNEASDSAY